MTMTRTIGGDRLGSGKKMTVDMKTYERSTHDLGYIWRSTMAAGTLVPFMTELGLPGDTFDIELDCNIMTHPTIGPLFGSYKVQLDVFKADIRLYQGELHNNKLGIGLKMADIKLPLIRVRGNQIDPTIDVDNQQINPSCILSYLNIRGLGRAVTGETIITRDMNGVPFLAYWDIYKNYYANKQEEIGAVIHGQDGEITETVDEIEYTVGPTTTTVPELGTGGPVVLNIVPEGTLRVTYTGAQPSFNDIVIMTSVGMFTSGMLWSTLTPGAGGGLTWIDLSGLQSGTWGVMNFWRYATPADLPVTEPLVHTFPLENLDLMRENILQNTSITTPFVIGASGGTYAVEPYSLVLSGAGNRFFATLTQEGLALKTYQSDLFNNWMLTEWIDGTNGINEITSIDTSGGSFTIDQLNLSKKVYDMLNRIAISGGSYDDWIETVYTNGKYRNTETPEYMGGLIKELVFQEVISNSQSSGEGGSQPLGTLAGRGIMGKKHKGGRISIKVDEPCYIMGIISLTPRLDYSQGNKWDTNLKTMDDLHKPALDEIGFQDLITDQMAWWDTLNIPSGSGNPDTQQYASAGKQPAWINYMTNVNQVRGNFAVRDNEMFMTLNRRYEIDTDDANPANWKIADLTTYIDPMKFNHIFAQTARDAQNYWVQIGLDITARRKMSARIIPNL